MLNSKTFRWIVTAVIAFSITACGNIGRQDATDDPNGQRVQPYQSNHRHMQNNDYGHADNNRTSQDNHVRVSKEIADKLVAMKEVKSANVFLTDRHAYVAVVLDEEEAEKSHRQTRTNNFEWNGRGENVEHLADSVKQKIADTVKSVAPEVDDVYTSANPAVMERLDGFVDQLSQGRPAQAVVDEFNTVVERIFPQRTNVNGTERSDVE